MIDGVMKRCFIGSSGELVLTAMLAFSAARALAQPAICEGPGCGVTDSPCEGPGCGMTPLPPCEGPGCGKEAPARGRLERAAAGLGALQKILAGDKPLLPEQRAALLADLAQLVESGEAVYGGVAPAQKDFVMMAKASLRAAKMDAASRGASGGRRLGPLLAVTLRQLSFLKGPSLQGARTPSPVEEFLKSADGSRLYQEVLEDSGKAAEPPELPAQTDPCSGPGCELIPPPVAGETGEPVAPAQEVPDPMAEATRTVLEATRQSPGENPASANAKKEAKALYLEALQARDWGLALYNSHRCDDGNRPETVPAAAYNSKEAVLSHFQTSLLSVDARSVKVEFTPQGRFDLLILRDKNADRVFATRVESGGQAASRKALAIIRDECPGSERTLCQTVSARTRYEIATPPGKNGYPSLTKTRLEPGEGKDFSATVTGPDGRTTRDIYENGRLVSSKPLPLEKPIPGISAESERENCLRPAAQRACYLACVDPRGFVEMLRAQGVAKTNLVETKTSRKYIEDGHKLVSLVDQCCRDAWTQIKMIWAIEVAEPKLKR